jgi:hypothetical protein
MRFEGVLRESQVTSFLRELEKHGPDSTAVLDLREVDRVQYEALVELVVVAGHLASSRRGLLVHVPSDVALPNERARIRAGRSASAVSTTALIARSAMARFHRRQALRKELVANGFLSALQQAYSLHGADGLLEIEGISPRLLGRSPSQVVNSHHSEGERIRRVPFQWLVLGSGTASASDFNPLTAGRLRNVLSQEDEIVSLFDAAAIERYVIRELLQNVDEHAYADGSGGVRAILVGAVAMWATSEIGISATFGPDGKSIYMFEAAPEDTGSLATLAVGDSGVGIPSTLPVTQTEQARLRSWAPDLRRRAGNNEQSVAWAFHPLSTRRRDLPESKRGFRGLSYVMGQARRYRGLIHIRSLTATVDWSFLEGTRTLTSSARPSFPGTSVAVTLTAPRVAGATASERLTVGSRDVTVTPVPSDGTSELIDELIDLEAGCTDETVLAFAVEPKPGPTSLDRHLLQAVDLVRSAASGWSRERPWFCIVPCTAADADALLNAVEDNSLSEDDRAEAGISLLDDAVLVLGVDGVFAWVGGSTQERASLTHATSLGRGVPVTVPAGPTPLTPWLTGRGGDARPIAGEVDLLDGVATAVSDRLVAAIDNGKEEPIAGVTPGEHLLRSLHVVEPLIDLDQLLRSQFWVTATACALDWHWRSRMSPDASWRYSHTSSLPDAIAELLNSRPLDEITGISHSLPDETPIVVLEGTSATANSTRSELSLLIKEGIVPIHVAGILDVGQSPRSEVRAVFTVVPSKFLVSTSLIRPPNKSDLSGRQERSAPAFDLHGLLAERPQAIQIGHFSRRRGRHMDVFVDVAHIFPNTDDAAIGASKGLEALALAVRSTLTDWRTKAGHSPAGVDILYPADDFARAGAFARWLQPIAADLFDEDVSVASLAREVSSNAASAPSSQRSAILADWGAVTAGSLHAMLVNVARNGYSHALTLLLTSQLGDDQELIESSIRLIEVPQKHGGGRMNTAIEILSRLDLGYSLELECQLCRARANILKLVGTSGIGSALQQRAAHRADELSVRPVPAPTRAVEIDPSQAAGPALVALRARLRSAESDDWDKLVLYWQLELQASGEFIDPTDPSVLAWSRLLVMEPQWMSGSAIDLDDFRAVLVGLFNRAIDGTVGLPQGTREEMQRLYLVALRVVSKSEFLRSLPRLVSQSTSEEVVLDGLMHVATMLERPYHQSLNALGLMSDSLEGVGTALKAAPDLSMDAARSAHYLLEQQVALAMRRASIGGHPQRGWDVLKTVYVGRQRRHEGLESAFDPLQLEISSSRIRNSLASEDGAVRREAVNRLLREPWSLCAQRLTEDVLPSLATIAPQLEVILPLVTTMGDASGEQANEIILDAWRRRLLDRRPGIFDEVESVLRRLEAGPRDVERPLEELQDVLEWAYGSVFRPLSNGGAALFECASSIPVDPQTTADLVRDLSLSIVGVRADIRSTLEARLFVASPVLENVVRRLLENVLTHRPTNSDVPLVVYCSIERVGQFAKIRIANGGTDPSVRSSVSGRHGLTAARRLLEPFGGRIEIVDPDDVALLREATFVVDVVIPIWATDSTEAA